MKATLLLLLSLYGATASAQSIAPEPNPTAPILAGLGLGAIGFLGGAVAGSKLSEPCSGDLCNLGGAAVGALIGETIGMSLGVHLGNRRRGNYGLDLLTSTGISALTLAVEASRNYDNNAGKLLVVGVIAQITGTVVVERGVRRAKARKGMRVSLFPTRGGGIGFSASIPLP